MFISNFPDDVMAWGAGKVLRLAHLKGFPENPDGVKAVVRAVLRIAHPGLVYAELHDKSRTEALAMTAAQLEDLTVTHSRLGSVKPMDFLTDRALETSQFFPAIPELRAMFVNVFPAADGEKGDA